MHRHFSYIFKQIKRFCKEAHFLFSPVKVRFIIRDSNFANIIPFIFTKIQIRQNFESIVRFIFKNFPISQI